MSVDLIVFIRIQIELNNRKVIETNNLSMKILAIVFIYYCCQKVDNENQSIAL